MLTEAELIQVEDINRMKREGYLSEIMYWDAMYESFGVTPQNYAAMVFGEQATAAILAHLIWV